MPIGLARSSGVWSPGKADARDLADGLVMGTVVAGVRVVDAPTGVRLRLMGQGFGLLTDEEDEDE